MIPEWFWWAVCVLVLAVDLGWVLLATFDRRREQREQRRQRWR
jgi:hypothetical protein